MQSKFKTYVHYKNLPYSPRRLPEPSGSIACLKRKKRGNLYLLLIPRFQVFALPTK